MFMDPNSSSVSKQAGVSEIHPPPQEFTVEEMRADDVLRFFHYRHLPAGLQAHSKPFCDLARAMIDTLPRSPQRTMALNKLLESKDHAVRASLPKPEGV